MLMLIAVPTMIWAQLSIGLQGGSNFSKMDFAYNREYTYTEIDNKQGFIGGLVIQFIGDKHAGIQAEFNYSQRGWVENDTTGVEYIKYKNQMDYLEMPILSHVNIGGGKLRGLFNIGPYLGYALNRSITSENQETGATETSKYNFDDEKDNRFDFGLMVGAGMEYRFNFGKIAAEGRYTFGFGDINKERFYQSEVSQFRIVSVLLRYTMPLTKLKTDPETADQ